MSRRVREQIEILQAKPKIAGPRVGTILSFSLQGLPVVEFDGNPFGPQTARAVSAIGSEKLADWHRQACPVLLVFEDSDASRPIIIDAVAVATGSRHEDVVPAGADVGRPLGRDAAVGRIEASVARLVGVEGGVALVDRGAGMHERARSVVPLRNLKDAVVLVDVVGEGPIIVGQILGDIRAGLDGGEGADLVLKGARVTIEADIELILKSGSSTLRLDARGKASTTADQIVSTARGSNKIRGGSVQLN